MDSSSKQPICTVQLFQKCSAWIVSAVLGRGTTYNSWWIGEMDLFEIRMNGFYPITFCFWNLSWLTCACRSSRPVFQKSREGLSNFRNGLCAVCSSHSCFIQTCKLCACVHVLPPNMDIIITGCNKVTLHCCLWM